MKESTCSVQVKNNVKDFIKYLQVKFSVNGERQTLNDIIFNSLKKQYPNELNAFNKIGEKK